MNIIVYKNDGKNIAINGIKFLLYDLSNKRVDFYFSEHKSCSLKLDEFWQMKVRENNDEKKDY